MLVTRHAVLQSTENSGVEMRLKRKLKQSDNHLEQLQYVPAQLHRGHKKQKHLASSAAAAEQVWKHATHNIGCWQSAIMCLGAVEDAFKGCSFCAGVVAQVANIDSGVVLAQCV